MITLSSFAKALSGGKKPTAKAGKGEQVMACAKPKGGKKGGGKGGKC